MRTKPTRCFSDLVKNYCWSYIVGYIFVINEKYVIIKIIKNIYLELG